MIFSIDSIYGQTTTTEWKTYTDPEGEYTIDYPSNWNLNPKENRFDEKELELNTIDDSGNSVHIVIKTMEQPNLDLEEKADDFAQILALGIPNFEEIEPIECEKYSVSGSTACSIIFTRDFSPQKAVLQLYAMDGDTEYILVYLTDPSIFDKYLPEFEQMIKTIKWVEG